MPHLVILYTPQLEAECDMGKLCRVLADTMLAVRDDAGAPVFPVAGTRVFAVKADHFAVSDGRDDHAFCYFNIRMAKGRSTATHKRAGDAVTDAARQFLAPVLARRPIGLTMQVDEGHEVFDAKFGNLHPLFNHAT